MRMGLIVGRRRSPGSRSGTAQRSSRQGQPDPLRAVDADRQRELDVGGAAGAGDEHELGRRTVGKVLRHAPPDVRRRADHSAGGDHRQVDRRQKRHRAPGWRPQADRSSSATSVEARLTRSAGAMPPSAYVGDGGSGAACRIKPGTPARRARWQHRRHQRQPGGLAGAGRAEPPDPGRAAGARAIAQLHLVHSARTHGGALRPVGVAVNRQPVTQRECERGIAGSWLADAVRRAIGDAVPAAGEPIPGTDSRAVVAGRANTNAQRITLQCALGQSHGVALANGIAHTGSRADHDRGADTFGLRDTGPDAHR